MRLHAILGGIALAVSAISAMEARADALRCGNDLILEGDPLPKVAALCGHPAYVEHSSIVRSSRDARPGDGLDRSSVEIPVEVWTYNLGPNLFMSRVRFEDGVVVRIDTLTQRGYIEPGR